MAVGLLMTINIIGIFLISIFIGTYSAIIVAVPNVYRAPDLVGDGILILTQKQLYVMLGSLMDIEVNTDIWERSLLREIWGDAKVHSLRGIINGIDVTRKTLRIGWTVSHWKPFGYSPHIVSPSLELK